MEKQEVKEVTTFNEAEGPRVVKTFYFVLKTFLCTVY